MPSMFERTTKKLVKEIGDHKLRPVKCLLSATKIHRFSLIQRKKARSRFWQLPDVPLDISLMHILEPGSSVPDAPVKVSADFSDSVVRKQQAAGNVNAGAEVGFSEETTVCRGSSLVYQIVSTSRETLLELQERKLLDPEPAFLRQCREAGVNLYVVTDTVELLNSAVLQDLSSVKVKGKFSISGNTWFQVEGEGQGGGLKVRQKKLTVPKGSVLAYGRKQLIFYSGEWEILHFGYRDDLETFTTRSKEPPREIAHWICDEPQVTDTGIFHIIDDNDDDDDDDDDDDTFSAGSKEPPRGSVHVTNGDEEEEDDEDEEEEDDDDDTFSAGSKEPPRGIFHITDDVVDDDDDDDDDDDTLLADFKLLQEEVSQNVKAAEISKGMRGVVFSNLLAMLGHREALQDLMDTLELEPFRHLEGPGGAILTELRKDSRYPEVGSKSLLFYLLEALMVLSDIQHDLLAQSMEKRFLVPQRDLVRGILEPNFKCFQNIPFTLQPELLAPLQGEGLVITYGLLDECGLKMELNSPRLTWTPKAKEPLSALYATLSVLTQLAEA